MKARLPALLLPLLLAACGGGSDGPRVSATPQQIEFTTLPAMTAGTTATARARAGSGLPVRYGSATPDVCSVDAVSGQVTALAAGTCTVTADQAGNADWAVAPQVRITISVAADPAQTITFNAAPALSLGGTATVSATASSGLPVRYASTTAAVCSVQAGSGVVTGLRPGECVISADQPGDALHDPAPQATLAITVAVPPGITVPRAPTGVTATLGADASTAIVAIGGADSGGSPITGYTVESVPAGVVATGAGAPLTVHCPAGCAGLAFTVRAANALGDGEASSAVDVITTFDIVTLFREPDTQPRDTLFTGSFTLNSTTGAVTQLQGMLTESMTGNAVGSAPYYDMTQVRLAHALLAWRDAGLGGSFVASFANDSTSTFTTLAGGDGWSPQAGIANGGIYAGFPAPHARSAQNAYVLVFVPDDPFRPLTPAQIDKLAYADCAPGGMMGAVCMTATSAAGYGAVGTMSGYPVSQRITRR